jgi:hypothetical protein
MQQSPSWEANESSATKEIPRVLKKLPSALTSQYHYEVKMYILQNYEIECML